MPGAAAILDLPFAFSQVPLFSSRKFLDEAKLWDYRLTLEDLQELNGLRLLVPFYRADDEAIPELVARPHPDDYSTIARYAREGMIRDHAAEDPSLWPHVRPADAHEDWWDGFFYSAWQLLGLRDALRERSICRIVPDTLSDGVDWSAKIREEHVALAALSARWFPRIIGQISYRDGADQENLSASRRGIDSRARLAVATFPAERLRPAAEHLLSRAHMYDPMPEWWDLIRHSDHKGWFRTRGGALEAIWQRLAAEVLLQAHEELAEAGDLQPLPDTEAAPRFWTPLLDRVGARAHTDGLERSLSRVSLNPHPRVLLVVEGETELLHVGALLEELGIGRQNQVRVDRQDLERLAKPASPVHRSPAGTDPQRSL